MKMDAVFLEMGGRAGAESESLLMLLGTQFWILGHF
jgi:hypothetical protein